MTNPTTTKASPETEPKPIGYSWKCSKGHKNVRQFGEEFLAKRAARNHKHHNHGGNLCRSATVTVSPVFAEVGQ